MLSFTNIINISALSYQSNVGVSFTFNPTLSVNISLSNLTIDNLTPGTTSDSNVINISVATNAAYGYTLSAIMDGNNSNLTHNNGTNVFSSIATDAGLSSLTTDNTWGYSYKLSNDTNWSNYSGLSTETSKTLVDSNDQTAIPIDFKIAAKASNTQASGTYTGTIIFTTVAKPRPKVISDLEYLQDFADLDEVNLASVKSSMTTHYTYTLKDKRDEQEYTIAKLADSKIWMTKNLNLAGSTTLTYDTTDFDSTYTIPNTQGWQANGTLPASNTSGFSNNNYAYVYNSSNNTDNCSSPGCYSYYSWDVATLGSGRSIDADNTDAPYSICPKGWKLPTSRTTDASDWQLQSDLYQLAISYGMSPNVVNQYNPNFYNQAGPGTIPNFLLTGYYQDSSFKGDNSRGDYWSSTSYSNDNNARSLFVSPKYIYTSDNDKRSFGFAVRCLTR